jgi:hypothetical protein
MKKFIKSFSYMLITVILLLVSQFSVFANNFSHNDSELTGILVLGGFVIMMLVVLLPLFKKSNQQKIV